MRIRLLSAYTQPSLLLLLLPIRILHQKRPKLRSKLPHKPRIQHLLKLNNLISVLIELDKHRIFHIPISERGVSFRNRVDGGFAVRGVVYDVVDFELCVCKRERRGEW